MKTEGALKAYKESQVPSVRMVVISARLYKQWHLKIRPVIVSVISKLLGASVERRE